MAIERWELAQRQKGNEAGAEIAKVLRQQYGDVALPHTEGFLPIQRFTPEDRKKIENAGLRIIIPLTARSIKTEKDAGKPFWSNWHKDYPDFEALTSRLSEVAINPDQLFLPDSNRKTLAEQEEMVEAYSKELQKKLKTKGIKAIIGEAPDYVELAFAHSTDPDECLFGKKYGFNYARTRTPIEKGSPVVAGVGYFGGPGLDVDSWDADRSDDHVFAVPLVVPA